MFEILFSTLPGTGLPEGDAGVLHVVIVYFAESCRLSSCLTVLIVPLSINILFVHDCEYPFLSLERTPVARQINPARTRKISTRRMVLSAPVVSAPLYFRAGCSVPKAEDILDLIVSVGD